jgi:hypothetical protein
MTEPKTVLTEQQVGPFDIVYSDVTKRIKKRAEELNPIERSWLLKLVDTFAAERRLWNDGEDLEGYRKRWARLRTRLLRLVAGAYLHISYDLPRAIADDWPGQDAWLNGPSEMRGEIIYQSIKEVFTESLTSNAKRVSVVGLYAFALRFLPLGMAGWISNWVLHLRRAAWDHARILATQPNRAECEAAMAVAMTAALEDASDLQPWNASLLQPPDAAVFGPLRAYFPAVAIIPNDYNLWIMNLILLIGVLLYQFRLSISLTRRSEVEFARYFALLVVEHVGFAIENPSGFDAYRQQRQSRAWGGGSEPPGSIGLSL